jgi:hypothetical protein
MLEWMPDPWAIAAFIVLFVGAITIFRWLKHMLAFTGQSLGNRWRSRHHRLGQGQDK